MSWRQPCLFLEESTKGCGVREVQRVGYLLHALVGIVHQENAASDDSLEHVLLDGQA